MQFQQPLTSFLLATFTLLGALPALAATPSESGIVEARMAVESIIERPSIHQGFKKALQLEDESQMSLQLIPSKDGVNAVAQKLILNLSGELTTFWIKKASEGPCGEKILKGSYSSNDSVSKLFGYQMELTLTDFRKSQCSKIPESGEWQASLVLLKKEKSSKQPGTYVEAGRALLAGQPIRVLHVN